jgi:hypothetical protein
MRMESEDLPPYLTARKTALEEITAAQTSRHILGQYFVQRGSGTALRVRDDVGNDAVEAMLNGCEENKKRLNKTVAH